MGTTPIRLNAPIQDGLAMLRFPISPLSDRVVFTRPKFDSGLPYSELFSAPIDGSTPAIKLNGPLATGGSICGFGITADGQRVVYVADKDNDEVLELYSVPVTGPVTATVKLNNTLTNGGVDGSSAAMKLHQPLPGGQTLVPYRLSISNNSQKVAFTINEQVYVAPITGPAGSATSFHDANILGATVFLAIITKDNPFVVVYKTISVNPAVNRIYRIPVNGPANAATAVFDGGLFSISDDSKFVIFNTNGSGNAPLYSMPLTGTQASAIKIAESTGGIPSFIISPNNQRVIYSAGRLFSFPSTGPADAKYPLSAQTNNGGGIAYYSGFQVSSDSRYTIYISDGGTLNKFELYSANEFGNFPNQLYLPLIRC